MWLSAQLALMLHPDKNKAPKAEEAFKKVSETCGKAALLRERRRPGRSRARRFGSVGIRVLMPPCMGGLHFWEQVNKVSQTLLDPQKRRLYDAGGAEAVEGGGPPSRRRQPFASAARVQVVTPEVCQDNSSNLSVSTKTLQQTEASPPEATAVEVLCGWVGLTGRFQSSLRPRHAAGVLCATGEVERSRASLVSEAATALFGRRRLLCAFASARCAFSPAKKCAQKEWRLRCLL